MNTVPNPDKTASGALKVVALVVLVLGLLADLGSKAWFEGYLGMDADPTVRSAARRVEVIEGFLAWEGAWNPGVTFGLAAHRTTEILALTGVATLALLAWLLATRNPSRLLHVGLAMILGGALGNLWDRWHWSKVRDFILVYTGEPGAESFKWPNFNVADSLIVVGVAFVMWDALFGSTAKRDKARALERAAAAEGSAS
ncbi:MAG: signal peptidase II [Planctomycetota bacterium]|nr:signal peptidase II [Planctomycetota bacterium]MCB9825594.1 signal peptidase II [Planctomycetota bacterium]MCB9902343.1 signal peptidase II [Planctomycetota bacterium]